MSDPKRWLDEPDLNGQLRQDLRRSAEVVPKYDASAGLAALQGAINAGAPTGTPAHAAGAKLSVIKLSASIGVGVAATAAVIAALALRTPASAPSTHDQRNVQPKQQPAFEPIRPPTPPAAPTPMAEPVLEERAPTAQDSLPIDRTTAHEIAQLARIKAVIDRDPALALRLAQQGHREFRNGVLRPEREGLAVVALYATNARAKADARARAYLARYPKGALAERVRGLLGAQE